MLILFRLSFLFRRISTGAFKVRLQPSKSYSTVLLPAKYQAHKVHVPIAGNGTVELDIVKASNPPSNSRLNVVTYLPPGPFFPASSNTADPPAPKLASTIPLLLASYFSTATVIILNYRLSPIPSPHTFPSPVFDTFKAFDYITSPSSPHNSGHTPRLYLYGSHIGGLLATTLALTEPTAVHALAVSEPIVDWVDLDENVEENRAKSSSTRQKHNSPTTSSLPDPARLLNIRSKLFRNPETYFDAFASPILFLRAPGRDCPSENPDPFLDPSDTPSPIAHAFAPYDDDFGAHPPTPSYQIPKRRKVLRRWPPISTQPILPPPTRVFLRDRSGGEAGVLRGQGKELVELMRRACFYGREKGVGEARVQLQKMADKAELEVEGIIGIREAAMWLRQRFDED